VIEGRCSDASGNPVRGARVYAWNDEGPFASADTDDDGRFRVVGVAGTRAQLRADAPQLAGRPPVPSASLPSVAVGATDVEIRFEPR
ncbi:MAG: carboxypeptidase regulatory-like domain-containing protein, partial [Planctomycetia bacterium]|nr:carboxypeptidase regulatory-like domain-containing protein [Planctomycetia bacterium]